MPAGLSPAAAASQGDAALSIGSDQTPTVLQKLEKWGHYVSYGNPVQPTRFIPCKTPLSVSILNNWSLPEEPVYSLTVPQLVQEQKQQGRKVGLIIDLSNHECLYSEDLAQSGLQYRHVHLVAKMFPKRSSIAEVVRIAQAFWREHPDEYVAIHCAYGFNRTGFVVCSYLVEACALTVDQALDSFTAARPPGVKHEKFREELRRRYDPELQACGSEPVSYDTAADVHLGASPPLTRLLGDVLECAGSSSNLSGEAADTPGELLSQSPGKALGHGRYPNGLELPAASQPAEERSGSLEAGALSPGLSMSSRRSLRASGSIGRTQSEVNNESLGFDEREALQNLTSEGSQKRRHSGLARITSGDEAELQSYVAATSYRAAPASAATTPFAEIAQRMSDEWRRSLAEEEEGKAGARSSGSSSRSAITTFAGTATQAGDKGAASSTAEETGSKGCRAQPAAVVPAIQPEAAQRPRNAPLPGGYQGLPGKKADERSCQLM